MEDESVVAQKLKVFVLSLEPHIREAGSWEQAEDTLLHLEENDKDFHRYEFVKQLKKYVNDSLGELVSSEIEKNGNGGEVKSQNPLVNQISDHVIYTTEFAEMFRKLKISLADASGHLIRNFGQEFHPGSGGAQQSVNRQNKARDSTHSDDEMESCYNSHSQGNLMFLSSEYFHRMVENLNKTNSIEMRKEALSSLNQIPVADIAGSEGWRQLRRNLLDALSDSDSALSVCISIDLVLLTISCKVYRPTRLSRTRLRRNLAKTYEI